jgi:hypothetical protein
MSNQSERQPCLDESDDVGMVQQPVVDQLPLYVVIDLVAVH